jgi:hypothetical protein
MLHYMTRDQVKEILDRVRSWPAADQEKLVRFVDEIEQRYADDDITDQEWEVSRKACRSARLGDR